MAEPEQKIVVWCDFSPGMDAALLHGTYLASILKKELLLLHLIDNKHQEDKLMAEAKMRGVAGRTSDIIPSVRVRYLVREHDLSQEMLMDLSEVYDVILMTAGKTSSKQLLPKLKLSGFPFLFVNGKKEIGNLYKRLVIPVGYMRRSKDLALWASYIGRNNQALVDLLAAREPGVDDRKRVEKNLSAIEVLFDKFAFPYQVIESSYQTWKLSRSALEHALGVSEALLIVSGNDKTTFIDNWLGLTIRKLLRKSGNIPVMCINSYLDLYTLCG
ncbi:hypothetical protein [Prolixibacter sp. SD074]|uniref:hypothetical protein n=1 Tax=Prolixibacter sp. SD074 TaxID=2652391 RepID=UPI00127E0A2A|nr:hypothetical protein [Prolixibacter sp. SD074]GET29707.1 hypothetical protein SD074_19090 [Prolixibacter sp. SD074]